MLLALRARVRELGEQLQQLRAAPAASAAPRDASSSPGPYAPATPSPSAYIPDWAED